MPYKKTNKVDGRLMFQTLKGELVMWNKCGTVMLFLIIFLGISNPPSLRSEIVIGDAKGKPKQVETTKVAPAAAREVPATVKPSTSRSYTQFILQGFAAFLMILTPFCMLRPKTRPIAYLFVGYILFSQFWVFRLHKQDVEMLSRKVDGAGMVTSGLEQRVTDLKKELNDCRKTHDEIVAKVKEQ